MSLTDFFNGGRKTKEANNNDLLSIIYPVGSIYIGVQSECPFNFGTWEKIAEDRVLQGAGSRGLVGTTINESLPQHTHTQVYPVVTYRAPYGDQNRVAWENTQLTTVNTGSASGDVYKDGAPVQQNAYLVNIWKRTA